MNIKENGLNAANEIAKLSWRDKLTYKSKVSLLRTSIICLCILLCVLAYFASDAAKHAVDRNYDYLESLIIEYETEIIETGENGIIVQGNENITAGGDVSGPNQAR